MKLEDIGFYTLSDERAKSASHTTPIMRAEIIITDKCNFSCPYCKGVKNECTGEMSKEEGYRIISDLLFGKLQNVRFSGGEPTLNKNLVSFVRLCRENDVKRIAISTNGSADFETYLELIYSGVNDFSISLDACCASMGNSMSGNSKCFEWDKLVNNIKQISKLVYTTVGVVITKENLDEIEKIVSFAEELGVHDIRIIPESNFKLNRKVNIYLDTVRKYKILKYRLDNLIDGRDFRGLRSNDYELCPLVLDDIAIAGRYHYPCIIYLREHGNKIGDISDIYRMRKERLNWYTTHNCKEDKICRENCLDVCVDYNNKWLEYKVRNLNNLLNKKGES